MSILSIDTFASANVSSAEAYSTNSGNSKEGRKTTEWHDQNAVGSSFNINDTLQLTTGNDFTMRASTINAANALIEVGGDFAMLEAYDTRYFKSVSKKKGFFSSKTTTNIQESSHSVGSALNVGNLMLEGEGDALFRGATITVDNSALLDFAGNVNVLATMDYDYSYSKTVKSGFLGYNKSASTGGTTTNTVVGSVITAGGNLSMSAGGDMLIAGSTINADSALLDVGGNLIVINAFDKSIEESSHEKTSRWGLKGRGGTNYDYTETVVGSEFNVDNGLTIVSGEDSYLIGSNINAGSTSIYTGHVVNDDGTLSASGTGGSFYMANAYDRYKGEHYSYSYSVGFELDNFLRGMANGSLINSNLNTGIGLIDGLTYEREDVSDNSSSRLAVQSQINTGDLTIVSAEDVNLQGKINVQNRADILAGFTQNRDGTLSQNDKGTVTIKSDVNSITGDSDDLSWNAEIDTKTPWLDVAIKGGVDYSQSTL